MGNTTAKHELHQQLLFDRHFQKGHYKEAIHAGYLHVEFLSEQKKIGNVDVVEKRANTLNKIAEAYLRLGCFGDSLEITKQAIDLLLPGEDDFLDLLKITSSKDESKPKKDYTESKALAVAIANMGCIYRERGEYEQALVMLKIALIINETKNPESSLVAKNYGNIAVVLTALKRPTEAMEAQMRSIKIKRKVAPRSYSLALALCNLSMQSSPLPESRFKLVSEAKDIISKYYPRRHDAKVLITASLAHAHFWEKDYTRAIELFKEAIKLEESVAPNSFIYGKLNIYVAIALETVGGSSRMNEAREARKNALRTRLRTTHSSLLVTKPTSK